MSGGSYDHFYNNVQYVANQIAANHPKSPPHLALSSLMFKLSAALKAVEWVDSGDTSEGDDLEAIRNLVTPAMELEEATTNAREALKELYAAIIRAGK